MRAALKDRVSSAYEAGTDDVTKYYIRFEPFGWAVFYIDHPLGGLTITSDWGSWSYLWSGGPKQWGHPTFVDFLRDRASSGYLADKLSYGRTRHVPDDDATWKGMAEHIIERRRDRNIDKHEAREYWRAAKEFCHHLNDGIEAAYLNSEVDHLSGEFECLHEWVVSRTAPKVVFLREELLPTLLGYLRKELTYV